MNKAEYAEYLKSEHWKKLRRQKLKKHGGKPRCGICNATENIQCHHLQYRNIYDVRTGDLRQLCDRCHELAHQLIREGKLNLSKYNTNHAFFAVTKTAVKKALGLTGVNMFKPKKETGVKRVKVLGRPAKYPWDDWFDKKKQPITLCHGKDVTGCWRYDCKPNSLRIQAYQRAVERGLKVSVRGTGEVLVLTTVGRRAG